MTDLASTATGKAVLLAAGNLTTAVMQQAAGAMRQSEFQMMKTVSEMFYQFAKGG